MKYEDLVKMSVKELKDRLKDLNTQAQAAAGKDLDALLEEATTITGILDLSLIHISEPTRPY